MRKNIQQFKSVIDGGKSWPMAGFNQTEQKKIKKIEQIVGAFYLINAFRAS